MSMTAGSPYKKEKGKETERTCEQRVTVNKLSDASGTAWVARCKQ